MRDVAVVLVSEPHLAAKSHDIKLQGDYLLSDRDAGDELEGRFIGRVQVIF
jgi:hypothetical protein